MDLTSHKEHHIIKCLGLAHREEKCGMSPADREEDLMLFIREHLPETAFSPFALDTAPLPLQSAYRHTDTGRKRTTFGSSPHALFTVPSVLSHPGLGSQDTLSCPLLSSLCFAPFSIFLAQRRSVTLKALSLPCSGWCRYTQLQPHLPFNPDPSAFSQLAIEMSGCLQGKAITAVLLGRFPLNSRITGFTQGGGERDS